MQSRRDQVRAHPVVLKRPVPDVLRAEPDAPDTPTRDATTGPAEEE
ncbi:hypothetical protein [Kitasatospora sp. NPDC056800]